MQRWSGALFAAGVLSLATAVPASANQYLVTSCHDPLGASNAAEGWSAFSTPGGLTNNACGEPGGGLRALLPAANPPGNATANWRFDAPAGTRIVRVSVRRTTAGLAGSNQQAKDISYVMATDTGQILEDCTPAPAGSSCVAELTAPIDRQGLNAANVEFRVLCLNAGSTCSRPLGVQATHLWVTLEDTTGPTVANARVLDDGDTSGRLRVSFDAADAGGGVYRTVLKVDGAATQAATLGAAPCTDVDTRDADPFQFTVPVPCPLTVAGARGTVDVRALPPGPHVVELAVQDAAGNETSAFGPIEFPRANVATTGSSSPADIARIRKARLRMWFVKARKHGTRYRSRYGTRVVTRGVLRTRDGKGVQGARIDVYHVRNGKRRLLKTGLKSRAGGKLTLILPNNVDTRTIEYAYRALRPGPVTSRQRMRLTVMRHGRVYHR
jgi:hypothetical protein